MAVYDSSWTLKNHARPWGELRRGRQFMAPGGPPFAKASVFVKTSPDMSARQAIQAEKRQVVLKADRINFDLALDP
jgi:hypothetical protein